MLLFLFAWPFHSFTWADDVLLEEISPTFCKQLFCTKVLLTVCVLLARGNWINTACKMLVALTTGVHFTKQFVQWARTQDLSKWLISCCSVSPTFMLKLYSIFYKLVFMLNPIFWRNFGNCCCHKKSSEHYMCKSCSASAPKMLVQLTPALWLLTNFCSN